MILSLLVYISLLLVLKPLFIQGFLCFWVRSLLGVVSLGGIPFVLTFENLEV